MADIETLDDAPLNARLDSPLAVCFKCTWWHGNRSCAAFARIPDEIWLHGNPHTESVFGDGGLTFEQVPGWTGD